MRQGLACFARSRKRSQGPASASTTTCVRALACEAWKKAVDVYLRDAGRAVMGIGREGWGLPWSSGEPCASFPAEHTSVFRPRSQGPASGSTTTWRVCAPGAHSSVVLYGAGIARGHRTCRAVRCSPHSSRRSRSARRRRANRQGQGPGTGEGTTCSLVTPVADARGEVIVVNGVSRDSLRTDAYRIRRRRRRGRAAFDRRAVEVGRIAGGGFRHGAGVPAP